MKKIFTLLSLTSLIALVAIASTLNPLKIKRTEPSQIAKMWGKSEFDAEKFKNGTLEQRSSMAWDIVSKRRYIGSDVKDVLLALGRHDAYFRNDFVPAYALTEGWKTDTDTWQIVFLPNSSMKIVDVFVNKNCCDK